jgi:hypothetical protein
MILKRKFFIAAFIALIVVISSLFYAFIPCKKMPNVPNPENVAFSFCVFETNSGYNLESLIYYFGFINNPSYAVLALWVGVFLPVYLILSIIFRSSTD